MAKVTVIPSKINPITLTPVGQVSKRRVAAYARVSTDSDEQYSSYEAQVGYYTNFIKGKPNWEFIKVYADEGISGTSTKRRDDFNEMINATKMRAYLEAMKQADDYLEIWSEEAWILMVETATVNRDKTITFKFVNGKEVRV